MTLRMITKNHAADLEIGFLPKSISKPNGCATAMPNAWELNSKTLKQHQFVHYCFHTEFQAIQYRLTDQLFRFIHQAQILNT